MKRGVYTFPDKSEIVVYYDPDKSTSEQVYVEWYADNKIKHTMYLPAQGLRYKP